MYFVCILYVFKNVESVPGQKAEKISQNIVYTCKYERQVSMIRTFRFFTEILERVGSESLTRTEARQRPKWYVFPIIICWINYEN